MAIMAQINKGSTCMFNPLVHAHAHAHAHTHAHAHALTHAALFIVTIANITHLVSSALPSVS